MSESPIFCLEELKQKRVCAGAEVDLKRKNCVPGNTEKCLSTMGMMDPSITHKQNACHLPAGECVELNRSWKSVPEQPPVKAELLGASLPQQPLSDESKPLVLEYQSEVTRQPAPHPDGDWRVLTVGLAAGATGIVFGSSVFWSKPGAFVTLASVAASAVLLARFIHYHRGRVRCIEEMLARLGESREDVTPKKEE